MRRPHLWHRWTAWCDPFPVWVLLWQGSIRTVCQFQRRVCTRCNLHQTRQALNGRAVSETEQKP